MTLHIILCSIDQCTVDFLLTSDENFQMPQKLIRLLCPDHLQQLQGIQKILMGVVAEKQVSFLWKRQYLSEIIRTIFLPAPGPAWHCLKTKFCIFIVTVRNTQSGLVAGRLFCVVSKRPFRKKTVFLQRIRIRITDTRFQIAERLFLPDSADIWRIQTAAVKNIVCFSKQKRILQKRNIQHPSGLLETGSVCGFAQRDSAEFLFNGSKTLLRIFRSLFPQLLLYVPVLFLFIRRRWINDLLQGKQFCRVFLLLETGQRKTCQCETGQTGLQGNPLRGLQPLQNGCVMVCRFPDQRLHSLRKIFLLFR